MTVIGVEMLPDWHQPSQGTTFCLCAGLLGLTLLQISASVTHFVNSFGVMLGVAAYFFAAVDIKRMQDDV